MRPFVFSTRFTKKIDSVKHFSTVTPDNVAY